MRKNILFFCGIISFIAVVFITFHFFNKKDEFSVLRKKHELFLNKSPFKKTLQLSKSERKSLGIPPNKYYEREWELTMNPNTGLPEPEKVNSLQKKIKKDLRLRRNPGDAVDNKWIERGPNNVGGRTRALFFDPTDPTNKRVFAGGVSGGLWKTEDITVNGGWTLVTSLATNLSITSFAIDPNDSNTWYLGSGEQTSWGAAVGRGIYKTTDAGTTWTQVLDVYDFKTSGGNVLGGVHFINDIIAWDNNGTTEIYIGVSAGLDNDTNPTNFLGSYEKGLYKSINGGISWAKDTNVGSVSVNDFEIDANGNLWLVTTKSYGIGGSLGGAIYKRAQGAATTFSLITTIPNVKRTELEASVTDPLKFYVLAETNTAPANLPIMYLTTDAFATALTTIALPNDPDTTVPANDFTRGQAFYDLMIESDPTNDDIVYIGGINLHRSTNSGTSWTTISYWSHYYSTNGSLVHADQHALTFHPTDANKAILGHDGGVSYASDLSVTGNELNVIYDVDDDYNVTQFYSGTIAPALFKPGEDWIAAGAQDNGTQFIANADPLGPDNGLMIKSGDGAYTFYDQVDTDYLVGNFIYNNSIELWDYSANDWRTINKDNNRDGSFINPAGLDSNLDILYTNGSKGATKRIYRYSGLTAIPAAGSATKTTLTNALLTDAPTAFTISPYTTTSTTMLVGTTNSKLLLVTDANTAAPVWSDISGASFVGSISDVEYGATENDIFVTFHNYGVTSIFYSDDGGTSWSAKEGNLPDMPVKCILQNPLNTNEVIVGTELGVWGTTNFSDAAPIWAQSINGMSDVKVTDLDLRASDNTVLAATFGRGMFTGKFTTVALRLDDFTKTYGLKVYPTITEGIVTLSTDKNLEDVALQVFDTNGRLVYTDRLNVKSGATKNFNFDNLSAGIYFIKFESNDAKETIRFIKK